jgi:Tol biopolymer transport system component
VSGYAVFVRDTRDGLTVRASDRSDGGRSDGDAYDPAISTDGRYVAFTSSASDLAAKGDGNSAADVFVWDRRAGKVNRVSVSRALGDPNGASGDASISTDGRRVAFWSTASNLVRHDDNGSGDIFVYDRTRKTTALASIASDGTPTEFESSDPALSGDGRYVSFTSYDPLAPEDTNDHPDVYVHDLGTGLTELASTGPDGVGNHDSWDSSISDDGRYVAFMSAASNLVEGDTIGASPSSGRDVFVRDRFEGTTERVSVGEDGSEANGNALRPSISSDGRYVCWTSRADNLVTGDTNEKADTFVRGPLH